MTSTGQNVTSVEQLTSAPPELGWMYERQRMVRMVRMVGCRDSGNLPNMRRICTSHVTYASCFSCFRLLCTARSSKAHGQLKNCFLTSNLNRYLLTAKEKEWGRHALQEGFKVYFNLPVIPWSDRNEGPMDRWTDGPRLMLSRLFTPEVWGVGACTGEKTCKTATDLRRKKITLCQWNNGKQPFSTQSKDV